MYKNLKISGFNPDCAHIYLVKNYIIKKFFLDFNNIQGRTTEKCFSTELFFYVREIKQVFNFYTSPSLQLLDREKNDSISL